MKYFVLFLFFIVTQCNAHKVETETPANEHQNAKKPQHQWVQNRAKRTQLESSDEALITRIHDRLINSIDYKLTRFAKTNSDQADAIRSDIRELKRSMQNIESENIKIENAMKQLQTDVSDLREIVDSDRQNRRQDELFVSPSKSLSNDEDINQQIGSLGLAIVATKHILDKIEKEVIETKKEVGHLVSKNKEMSGQVRNVARNIITMKSSQPVYTMIQGNDGKESLQLSTSCLSADSSESGVRKFKTSFKSSFYAYCDMEQDNGNWIVIQNRFDGSIDFYKGWAEYVHGFGNVAGEFWLGLEQIHELTSSRLHELLIVLEDHEGLVKKAHYSAFGISGEPNFYSLNLLGTYSGDAGDSLSYHAGRKFTTFDMDNDGWQEGNCARSHLGAFWYDSCDHANLNGKYLGGEIQVAEQRFQGMYWNDFGGPMYALKSVKMMIRPIES